MNRYRRISEELSPHVDHDEAEAIDRLAEQLDSERPLPRAGFRADLRARLTASDQLRRPQRLRLTVGAYLASGLTLIAVAAVGLTGAGPLGY